MSNAKPRHALVVLAIGENALWQSTLPTMQRICTQYGWAFRRIDIPRINIHYYNDNLNITFEKFQCVDYLQKYERILLLDADVLLNPNCPNVFDKVPKDTIGCVMEDKGTRRINRLKQIEYIKTTMCDPRIKEWKQGYMNSGVLVLSKCHRKHLFLNPEVLRLCKGGFIDQNVMNYLCRASGFPILDLGYKYNHMHMFSEEWNQHAERRDSYIIHYAGCVLKMRQDRAQKDYIALWEN